MAIPYLTTTALPYGSRVVTISSVGYIANNFSVAQSLNVIERQDSLGAPNGAVGIQQARTGSAQLQLATSSTTAVAAGDSFLADTVTYFVTEVSKPEEQQGFKVLDVSFRESV
jgi:hypothetical protein